MISAEGFAALCTPAKARTIGKKTVGQNPMWAVFARKRKKQLNKA
jgi:hypothetical protein